MRRSTGAEHARECGRLHRADVRAEWFVTAPTVDDGGGASPDADRIAVIAGGRLSPPEPAESVTAESLGLLMAGGEARAGAAS